MGSLVFHIYIIEQHTIFFMSIECALMMQCPFLSSGRQTSLICLFQRSQHYLQHHMQWGWEDFKHVSWNDTSGTEDYRSMGKNFSLHEKQSDLCWKGKRMKSPVKVSQVLKTWWNFFAKRKSKIIQTPYTTFRHHLEVHWIRIEFSGCWEKANNNKMFNTINFNKITKTNLVGTIGWNQILPRARKQRKNNSVEVKAEDRIYSY